MRRYFHGLLAVYAVILVLSLHVFAKAPEGVEIRILHTNDIHGRVMEGIGFGRLFTIVRDFRRENPYTLLLDGGDTFHGTAIANVFQGEGMVRLMNEIGFDGSVAGNHDFNYGWQRLVELREMADFPILGANVSPSILGEYEIFTVGGVRVGVFGLATPETPFKTHPKNVEGLTFKSPVEVARALVSALEPQVDVIVAVGHLGVDMESFDTSLKVIEEVPGIDLFIDGHSHTLFPTGTWINETLLVSTGGHLEALGIVELTVAAGEVVHMSARTISAEDVEKAPQDPGVLNMIEELLEAVQMLGQEEIGTTSVHLEGARIPVRTKETNLGNFVADVLLEVSGADISFINGGSIRDSIEAGTITVGDINRVFPFGNYIQVREVTGAQIREILEYGTKDFPSESSGFLQVGGMSFVINKKNNRLENIFISGRPLELNATYTLATNDFLGAGGDGYWMLVDTPLIAELMTVSDALIDYIKAIGTIAPTVDGRIRVETGHHFQR